MWQTQHLVGASTAQQKQGGDQECRYDIGTNILAGSESSLLLILSIYTDRYQEIGLKSTDTVAFTWRFSMQIKQMRLTISFLEDAEWFQSMMNMKIAYTWKKV